VTEQTYNTIDLGDVESLDQREVTLAALRDLATAAAIQEALNSWPFHDEDTLDKQGEIL
jgi:hypothetical protein